MFRTKLLTVSTRIDGGRVTPKLRTRSCAATLLIAAATGWSTPVLAHVKWFAPLIVGAATQLVSATLTNIWFWIGVALGRVCKGVDPDEDGAEVEHGEGVGRAFLVAGREAPDLL